MRYIHLILILFLFSCTSESSFEEQYTKTHFPNIMELSEKDSDDFIFSLEFDKDSILTSWDNKLLRKAYPIDIEYDEVLAFIVRQFGGDTEQPIVVVGDNNEEYVVESQVYTTLNNEDYSLSEIKSKNAVFLITSTTCGVCVQDFKELNKFTEKYKDFDVEFIALLDKVENIDAYKKSRLFKNFGFLNDNWSVFSLDELSDELNEDYHMKMGYPYMFIRKDGEVVSKLTGDLGEVEVQLNSFFQ